MVEATIFIAGFYRKIEDKFDDIIQSWIEHFVAWYFKRFCKLKMLRGHRSWMVSIKMSFAVIWLYSDLTVRPGECLPSIN